jgi:hypothetical protein
MYQAQPQLEQCSQAQLLQLTTLADSLDAQKVTAAASRQLQRIAADPSAELQWETAMQIYSLPPACPEVAAYKPLYAAAAKRVQQDLGDLEAVCQDTAVPWPKVLQLPQLALLHVLSSRESRVASEDTVVYVNQSWAAAQQQQPTEQQMQQLCSTIKLAECSPMYLVSVLTAWPLIAESFTTQDLTAAALLSGSARGLDAMQDLQESDAAAEARREMANLRIALANFGALGPQVVRRRVLHCSRRVSESGGLLYSQHAVPLRLLEMAVTSALAGAVEAGLQEPAAYCWSIPARQGRSYSVWLQAEPAINSAAAGAAEAAAAAAATVEAAAAAGAVEAAAAAPVARYTLNLSLAFGNDMPQVCLAATVQAAPCRTCLTVCIMPQWYCLKASA